jgi:hypothetical protein
MRIPLLAFVLVFSFHGFAQTGLTSREILNRDMIYEFNGGSLLIRISSDTTLFWRDDSKPKEAYEKTKTVHLDAHTLMTAWYESDKTFVSMLSDFGKMKVTCMVCRADGKFYPIEGKIRIKE